MNVSTFKIIAKYLTGGISGVIEYLLDLLRNALANLGDTTKEKIQAALNLALKILSVLTSVRILVPTKWQTAYTATVEAVAQCVDSLTDLDLTKEELDIICDKITAAVKAWKEPDGATEVTFKDLEA